jgi:hypothetical protein
VLGIRLVGKNPDPDFSAALDEPRHGDTRSLKLLRVDPSGLHCLQTELAEVQAIAPAGNALHATPLLFSPFYFFWCEH